MKRGLLIFFLTVLICSCVKKEYFKEKVSSHLEVAKIYLAEGRYQDALRELNEAIATDQCEAEIFNLLGVVYLNLKDYQKAQKAFEEALKLDPNLSEALNNLGLLYLIQGRNQQAITYFERALSNPFYANAHSAKANLAQAYYLLGEKNKALDLLYALLRERADYAPALIKLGQIYLSERNLDSAQFYFKQALKLDRGSAEARYYLGEVFLLQGKIDLAKEIWESLVQTQPTSQWSSLARERIFFLERLKASNSTSN